MKKNEKNVSLAWCHTLVILTLGLLSLGYILSMTPSQKIKKDT